MKSFDKTKKLVTKDKGENKASDEKNKKED